MKLCKGRHILLARTIALIAAVVFCVCCSAESTFAEITGDDAFNNSVWTFLFEDIPANNGVVQSVCCTDEYLITIENTSDDPSQPDTVSAYYKNPFDKDGNPVQQYSLVSRTTDMDWEHGNGMTYNPNTNEIYVALYSNDAGDNEGSIYVMDPDTLSLKRKIQIAEGYNILGIDYDADNDVYYTLTNADASFSLQRRDTDFNLLEDYGPVDPAPGTNFQDICVSGDYVFLSPLTYGMGIGDFMNIYSLSRRQTILSMNMDMGLTEPAVEAEGVCMAHKGVFVCPVTVTRADGSRYVRFYQTTLPWNFTIEACARGMTFEGNYTYKTVNYGDGKIIVQDKDGKQIEPTDSEDLEDLVGGTISPGSSKVLRDSSYTISFEPDTGYKVEKVYLDTTQLDLKIKDSITSYTIDKIDGNHRVTVVFKSTKPSLHASGNSGEDLSDTDSGTDSLSDIALSDAQITGGTSESQTDSTSEGGTTRRNAFLFTILLLFMLVLGLALVLILMYLLRVRRVRESRNLENDQDRKLRRGPDTDEDADEVRQGRTDRQRLRRTAGINADESRNVPRRSSQDNTDAGAGQTIPRRRKPAGVSAVAGRDAPGRRRLSDTAGTGQNVRKHRKPADINTEAGRNVPKRRRPDAGVGVSQNVPKRRRPDTGVGVSQNVPKRKRPDTGVGHNITAHMNQSGSTSFVPEHLQSVSRDGQTRPKRRKAVGNMTDPSRIERKEKRPADPQNGQNT